ncbi:hypothetical protein FACS1894184_20610 [Clostridia bacterium]|nr:hypothetical protein FACS1894184_20610 [Clostridia bacterium]
MKKTLLCLLALCMLLTAVPTLANAQDYTGYAIRVYSNSNSTERATWLVNEAKRAGFTISMDDNSVLNGDTAAIQAANENKDGDILFGLNETRWSQVVGAVYENLSLIDWTPSWAEEVGVYRYPDKAYGLVIQNILMLYRNDELGTSGTALSFDKWADIVDCGYTWYRQGRVGGTTNANINSSILHAFTDPASPAGGISIDGWKTLWKYCADGVFAGDSYGFDPLNRGEVQVSTFYSSSLYGKLDAAAEGSANPLKGTLQPENWALVEITDGTYYIAEYIGILNRAGRSEAETQAVTAFAEWFGSAEVQTAWGEEFDSYPCNTVAASMLYDEIPSIYTLHNFALDPVEGAGMNYADYVAAHSAEWTNIMTNLGFFWADMSAPIAEPDWASLDWSVLTQTAAQ